MTAPGQVASTAKDQGAEVLGTATDQAGTVASTAGGAAADVAGTAKEQAGNVVGEAVAQAKDLTSQVREQAVAQLGSQSDKLTSGLRTFSGQLSQGDTSGIVGQLLSEVGSRLETLTDHVERVGPEGLVEDLRSYARRNPGTFLLGAALAGLVGGRVAKGISASKDQQPSQQRFSSPGLAAGAAYDPLAGVSAPELGVVAGSPRSSYPESSYEPDPALGRSPLLGDLPTGGTL